MPMQLKQRLARLETQRRRESICRTCYGEGRFAVRHRGRDEPEPEGCPECGRLTVIRIKRYSVPIPSALSDSQPEGADW